MSSGPGFKCTYQTDHSFPCYYYVLVPPPTVLVTAPNNQTVGQSLSLQCEVTTVRGITSRVDIVWSSGTVLRRINSITITH